jgi:hypothetical protein
VRFARLESKNGADDHSRCGTKAGSGGARGGPVLRRGKQACLSGRETPGVGARAAPASPDGYGSRRRPRCASAARRGCCTKGSKKLWNLTGGRLIAICRSDEGRLPLTGHFQPSWHGSSHHRSTHRICGWFVRQPLTKAAAIEPRQHGLENGAVVALPFARSSSAGESASTVLRVGRGVMGSPKT